LVPRASLTWAGAGRRHNRAGKRATPETVVADVASFRHDENYELQFFEEYVEVTGDAADRLTSQQLFQAYEMWCELNGVRAHERKNNVYLSRSVSGFELDGVSAYEWKVQGRKVRGFNGIRWVVPTGD
jgi:phage/plasmid-associated DNA primase